MCGRYGLYHSSKEISERFQAELPDLDDLPRYNAAPTQALPVVRSEGSGRVVERMRWGLIPFWAKDPGIGSRLINARAETVAEKPAFRNALRSRRCLVPASGFYEWLRTADGKQPVHVRRRDGDLLALAGMWEEWRGPDGPVRTYAIITTGANALMAPIHDRMPVILRPEEHAVWLDSLVSPAEACRLLRPCPPDDLEVFPVSRAVNRAAFDGPECLQRVSAGV